MGPRVRRHSLQTRAASEGPPQRPARRSTFRRQIRVSLKPLTQNSMAADPTESKGFSLRRWSQRKHAAARDRLREADEAPAQAAPTDSPPASAVATAVSDARSNNVTNTDSTAVTAGEPTKLALPPIESLTIDSDYSPFMQPGVDATTKHRALKKLFSDPRFNVMDGLDVYIDDYSKPDPIDPAIVRTLNQARYIFNPPKTRVNAEGHVEDVPADDPRDDAAGDAAVTAGASDAALVPAPVVNALPLPDA